MAELRCYGAGLHGGLLASPVFSGLLILKPNAWHPGDPWDSKCLHSVGFSAVNACHMVAATTDLIRRRHEAQWDDEEEVLQI